MEAGRDGVPLRRTGPAVVHVPAMQTGRWLVGVRVKSGPPMDYELVAGIYYASDPLVELLDGVPDSQTGDAPGRTDYRLWVFSPASSVEFELSGLEGPADRFAARGRGRRVGRPGGSIAGSGAGPAARSVGPAQIDEVMGRSDT